jgi:hypothetical protein
MLTTLIRLASMIGILALAHASVVGASAQTLSTLDSNSIMGFETPAGWIAESSSPSTIVSSTTTRTQGSFAYALSNPANLVTITSLPVASTATALAGVGNLGAIFEVDVSLPIQQGNPVNPGSLQLFISCRSRQLNNVLVGKADFNGFRVGIYNTIKFPISADVGSALSGGSFNDLTFQFQLHSPGTGAGTYLFDNLRVHSVALVTANASTRPPAGYGGSVDLVAIASTPASQLFDAGPVQVPDSFHLKLGTAGSTTVELDLGYDGTPAFTCTYGADSSDPTGKSYVLISCTGGIQAGDLLGASWAQLTIIGGDPSVKLRAQLARSPVGDLVGGGIIPPMPTFWGDSDGCTPAPVAGTTVTHSASCDSQAAEANQIVTAYFNKVLNSNTPPNWVVTPTPEFARRHGDGSPHNNLTGPPPPPNDPPVPFDQEGHMNPGGTFDAYWRLQGDFMTNSSPDNTDNTTDFDSTFSGHVVLFGADVDVLSMNSTIHTDTGQATATGFVSPKTNGSLHMYLFGFEIGGGNLDASKGLFDFNFQESKDFNLPPIQIWIFDITLGATASAGVNATGNVAPTRLDVGVVPFGSVGAHIEGGINIGIASGGVDARIDLLDVNTPMTASATWTVDTRLQSCFTRLDFSLDGKAFISSGGGEVDLVASFGPCPFCIDKSWTLFRWDPLVSYTIPLFHAGASAQVFQLPTSACQAPLNVTINSPSSTAPAGVSIPLAATVTSPNTSTTISCANAQFMWSVTAPDIVTGQGCNQSVQFNSSGVRTLALQVTYNPPPDRFGRIIPETGPASQAVTVTALPPGSYIVQTNPVALGNPQPPFNAKVLVIELESLAIPIQLAGQVIGLTGTTTTTWTAQLGPNGTPSTIGTGLNVTWNLSAFGNYIVTMTTTDNNGNVVGTATMTANVQQIPQ